jgi:hypothetical protein
MELDYLSHFSNKRIGYHFFYVQLLGYHNFFKCESLVTFLVFLIPNMATKNI